MNFRHTLARAALQLYPFRNGQGRIIDRTVLGTLAFPDEELDVLTTDGFTMTVRPNDHIGRHIFLTGKFDRVIAEVLLELGQSGDRVFDIGANIGYVSCVLLARLEGCRIASVEPQPDVFALLRRNLVRIASDRTVAIRAAVSTARGRGTMQVDAANRGASRLMTSDAALANTISVPLIGGEELMKRSRLDRIDLVKIDVEGHEFQVLSTMFPVLDRYRPRAVLFEHNAPLHETSEPIRSIFDALGYRIRGVEKRLNGFRLVGLDELEHRGRHAHDYVATRD